DITVSPGRVVYREIRLGETRPDICAPPADDPTGGGRPDVVKIPDLVGRTEAEAVRLLAAVGLKVGAREEVDAPDSPGRIVKQDPQAQTEVAPGSAVAIVVGARTDLRVPELIGMRVDDARVAIEKAPLTIGSIEVAVDQRRQGLVLKQDPAAGTRAEKGSAVALVVGRPETPAGPELVLSLAAADARFASVRLSGDELRAHAERLGLRDRQSLERLIETPDDKLRDSFALPALRDAQTLKRVLREALARTA
ncbi:MAG: PASTA domain-containing protein, partial [Myxococcota bacterium]